MHAWYQTDTISSNGSQKKKKIEMKLPISLKDIQNLNFKFEIHTPNLKRPVDFLGVSCRKEKFMPTIAIHLKI